jgi:mRNA interferase HigB
MRVLSRRTLVRFWEKHPDVEEALKAWFKEVEHASWRTPSEIKARYRGADFLPGNRIVFNIKGNKYRLVVKINFPAQIVYIRFIGTHAHYDRIDAEKI